MSYIRNDIVNKPKEIVRLLCDNNHDNSDNEELDNIILIISKKI